MTYVLDRTTRAHALKTHAAPQRPLTHTQPARLHVTAQPLRTLRLLQPILGTQKLLLLLVLAPMCQQDERSRKPASLAAFLSLLTLRRVASACEQPRSYTPPLLAPHISRRNTGCCRTHHCSCLYRTIAVTAIPAAAPARREVCPNPSCPCGLHVVSGCCKYSGLLAQQCHHPVWSPRGWVPARRSSTAGCRCVLMTHPCIDSKYQVQAIE